MSYWVEFADRKPGCIDAIGSEQAYVAACDFGKPSTVSRLPYPGQPRLNPKGDAQPSFCHHPEKCAGLNRCPREICCND